MVVGLVLRFEKPIPQMSHLRRQSAYRVAVLMTVAAETSLKPQPGQSTGGSSKLTQGSLTMTPIPVYFIGRQRVGMRERRRSDKEKLPSLAFA